MSKDTPIDVSPCNQTSRRTFIKAGAGLLAVAGKWPFSLFAADIEPQAELVEDLAGIIYDLFPHRDLPASLYRKAALDALVHSPEQAEEAVKRLRSLAHCDRWAKANKEARYQAIRTIEGTPAFYLIRSSGVQVIYRSPEAYELLGYGGPSIKHGGYLSRGFDDIAWLPTGT